MSTCTRCGAAFECGMVDTVANEPCWCTQLPTLPASAYVSDKDGGAGSCFCPSCLRALIAAQPAAPQENS